LFSKHDDVGIDGETDDSSSPAIPADAVNGLDEIAKGQSPLLVIGFHATTVSSEDLTALWGVDPTGDFANKSLPGRGNGQEHDTTAEEIASFLGCFIPRSEIQGASKSSMRGGPLMIAVFDHPADPNASHICIVVARINVW
jgi:hypothetical protein